ncbi:hypothetical protein CRENBAI_006787 [Crenichthys baileyi]|uniref:Uncharacterized protein n=1 Tax=Crenichthys baileyi TaxID=28760 RepID=A0AAV9S877_9TELE
MADMDVRDNHDVYLWRAEKRRRRRRPWVHQILQGRELFGEYHHLLQELRLDDGRFQRYFRLSRTQFEDLLSCVGRRIGLRDINYRRYIPTAERLSICLRSRYQYPRGATSTPDPGGGPFHSRGGDRQTGQATREGATNKRGASRSVNSKQSQHPILLRCQPHEPQHSGKDALKECHHSTSKTRHPTNPTPQPGGASACRPHTHPHGIPRRIEKAN